VFAAFEKLVDPYPAAEPEMPPKGLFAFCYHYTRPFLVPLVVMAALTALIAVIEIVFFAFIGDLVDWLAAANRTTFLDDHGRKLIVMGGMTSPSAASCTRTVPIASRREPTRSAASWS